MKYDKLIVSNVTALKAKYKASGYATIAAAVTRMIAADKKRGLNTRFVALDSADAMKRVGGPRVTTATDPKQNKTAIDAVYAFYLPDYLMLLGAIDVIPHQDLVNPVKDDGEATAWGDLPYACLAPYSTRIANFKAPTRVVGRLPDITGGGDASYLVSLIDTAAIYTCSPRKAYESYLGLTAQVWTKSTALSLTNTFGAATQLQNVPPRTAQWSAGLLKSRSHFINCHGGPGDPHFYGQTGNQYPIAHDAAYLTKRVAAGTVVAAECCFGAELYNPQVAAGQMSICNTYLGGGAYGFFGSSTTAYGPSSGNGEADLLCQYFLQRILAGASLGRAALEARQRYIQAMSVLDPADMKTLGQFSLLGDPSIHPVAAEQPAVTHGKAFRRALPDAWRKGRELRREGLERAGVAIGDATPAAQPAPKTRPSAKIRAALTAIARETKLKDVHFSSYTVSAPNAPARRGKGVRSAVGKTAFHVAVGRQAKRTQPISPLVLIIATEQDGELVRLRRLHSK